MHWTISSFAVATVDPHLAAVDLPVQLFWGERCGHFSYQDRPEEFSGLRFAGCSPSLAIVYYLLGAARSSPSGMKPAWIRVR